MGEVYRARDTKLNRDVALKILPDAFANDPDRLARFQREAQVLASLNHPNIAAIHGLEDSGDTTALVLELVEGPTLADRIAQGAIPVDEALPIARQIAEALEAAHEQGIVHRDLKPANVKIQGAWDPTRTPGKTAAPSGDSRPRVTDRTVKVLDFGLAKAAEPAGALSSSQSMSPTITTPAMTQAGMILGTAAYMSPEQARGKVVDRRADIWAFGCVLFEMLTGTRAFAGDDVPDTLAAVLRAEVNLDELPPAVPARLRQIVHGCLQRDPRQRIRDIGDVQLAMQGMFDTTADAPAGPADVRLQVWQRPMPALAVGLALLVVGAMTAWIVTQPDPVAPQATTRSVIGLPAGDRINQASGPVLALSPDGRALVYVGVRDGVRQLYRRQLDQLDAVPMPGTENARNPLFSPDGAWVVFASGDVLRKVLLRGGPVVTICRLPVGTDSSRGGAWLADDMLVFGSAASGLWQVPSAGGEPRPFLKLEEGEREHRFPEVLPGGRAVLFVSLSTEGVARVAVHSLETGERRVLLEGGHPRFLPTGHLVFARRGPLWAVPFGLDELAVAGEPVPVLEDIGTANDAVAAQAAFADSGALVYVTGSSVGIVETLVWVDREGREEDVGLAPGAYGWARVSPDGTRIAYGLTEQNNADVWVSDLTRSGTRSKVTTDPEPDARPVWTPDGKSVVFQSFQEERPALYRKAADGTGDVEQLLTVEGATSMNPYGWSPDGRMLLVVYTVPETQTDIGVLSVDDGTWQPLLETAALEGNPALSPNGEWIAYYSDETGQGQVYVARFPTLGTRQPVSSGEGWAPVWSPDGDEIFYQTRTGLMRVAVAAGPALTLGTPEVVFEGSYLGGPGALRLYDVAPTGERFLMQRRGDLPTTEGSPATLVLVQNWFEELTRLVPTE